MSNPPKPPATVQCPNCGKAVAWVASERWRPFCSERCRLIDLGHWASEHWRIDGEPAGAEDPPPD